MTSQKWWRQVKSSLISTTIADVPELVEAGMSHGGDMVAAGKVMMYKYDYC